MLREVITVVCGWAPGIKDLIQVGSGRWFHWNLNFPTQWGMYTLFNGALKLPFYSVTCALCVAKFKMNWSVILCDLYQSFKPNAGLRFRSLRIVYFVATLYFFMFYNLLSYWMFNKACSKKKEVQALAQYV